MMSASGAGLLIDGPGGSSQLVVRPAGIATGAPAEWSEQTFGAPTASHPDYSMTALQARWPGVQFASISTGGDICPDVDPMGKLNMTNIWYALDITVDAQTAGEATSLIRQQHTAAQTATIYSYTVEGSTGIAAPYADSVMFEQVPAQVGLPEDTQLRGLDWGIGVISTNPITAGAPMFPISDRLLFTVTDGWANSQTTKFVANPWTSVPEVVSAATIYRMNWVQISATQWAWSEPVIEVSYSELGLDRLVDEIDALSFYSRNTADRVVFSTNPYLTPLSRARNEILVFERERQAAPLGLLTTCATTALKTPSDATVSSKLGLRDRGALPSGADPDNVIGGCGRDPESIGIHNRAVGIAEYLIPLALEDDLGVSVVRTLTLDHEAGSSIEQIVCEAVGLDLQGSAQGLAVLFIGISDTGGYPTYNVPVWTPWGSHLITPATHSVSWDFPGDLSANAGTLLHFFTLVIGSDATGSPVLVQQSATSVIQY